MSIRDDDAETLVHARAISERMIRELAALSPQAPTVIVESLEIEVLPGPPPLPNDLVTRWQAGIPTVRTPRRPIRPQRAVRPGTKLHWAVLAMACAIAVGLALDRPSRHHAMNDLHELRKSGAALGHRVATRIHRL